MARLPAGHEFRKPDYPIDPIFINRWSPRAMTGETITHDELMALFEAARWAPSTYNEQEWRYLYAPRDSEHWQTFFDLLVEANQVWCKNAAVLIVILSHQVFERTGQLNPVHTFDAGASFENLALQGGKMGLVVHGMAGFSRDRAREKLHVPDDYSVEAMISVGRPADTDVLPEKLRDREIPSGRKAVTEFTRLGPFRF